MLVVAAVSLSMLSFGGRVVASGVSKFSPETIVKVGPNRWQPVMRLRELDRNTWATRFVGQLGTPSVRIDLADGRVVARNAHGGKPKWSIPAMDAAVDGKNIAVLHEEDGLMRLNPSGRLLQRRQLPAGGVWWVNLDPGLRFAIGMKALQPSGDEFGTYIYDLTKSKQTTLSITYDPGNVGPPRVVSCSPSFAFILSEVASERFQGVVWKDGKESAWKPEGSGADYWVSDVRVARGALYVLTNEPKSAGSTISVIRDGKSESVRTTETLLGFVRGDTADLPLPFSWKKGKWQVLKSGL